MIHNALFRQCLAAVPEDQKAEFELSYAIAERISEVLQAKNLTQKDFAQRLHKRESEQMDDRQTQLHHADHCED